MTKNISIKYFIFLNLCFMSTLFNNCAHINIKQADILINEGNKYYDSGEYNRAMDLYNQALQIHPNYNRALSNIANTYWKTGDYNKSIEYYSLIIEIDPNDENALYWRGRSYIELGSLDKSLDDMLKVITLNKGDEKQLRDASTTIGLIYYHKENYMKAIEYLTISIDRGSKIDAVFSNRANLYYITGNYRLAIQDANEALGINPNNELAKTLLERMQNEGISLNDRGITNISIIVNIGATINEYVQQYPFLTAISAYDLIDNRSANSGNVFLYMFNHETRKIETMLWRRYSSDRREWFNNRITQFLAEGHIIEQYRENNTTIILNKTPFVETDEYIATQMLDIDNEVATYYLFIEYKN